MNRPLRKKLSYTLSVVIGFGLFGAIVYYVGWRSILAQLHELGGIGIVAVMGNVFLTTITLLLGWWVILRSYGVRIPIRHIIGARMSGFAVSYLTPSLYFGGEPVRGLMAAEHANAPITRIFATIVVERFLGGLSLVMFILIGGFYAVVSPDINTIEKRVIVIGVAFVVFWIIIGLVNFVGNFKWISQMVRLLRYPFRRWHNGIDRAAAKVAETEDEIYDAFSRHWKGTLLAFLIQMMANFLVYMRPQVFFYFSTHHTFDFAQLSLLFTLNIMISFFLWITPGGLGTGEAASIGIFALVGVGRAEAVAFSLMFKFVELLLVGIGLFYLFNRGISRLLRVFKRRGRQH